MSDGNVISRVAVTTSGARTIVTLQGSAVPSFTAYRLTQPARLVVEVANSQLRLASEEARAQSVDSAAVGQLQVNQRAGVAGATTQVLLGLKRECLYTVRPEGKSLIITILPSDGAEEPTPPAEAAANLKQREQELQAQKEAAQREAAAQALRAQKEAATREVLAQKEREAAARLQQREQELQAQKETAARAELEAARLRQRERELAAQRDAAVQKEREVAIQKEREVKAQLALRERELLSQKEAAAAKEREAKAQLALRERELLSQKEAAAVKEREAQQKEREAQQKLALREQELLAQKAAIARQEREAQALRAKDGDATRLAQRERELAAQREALHREQAELQRRASELQSREQQAQRAEQRARELAAQRDALALEQARLSQRSAATQSREADLLRRETATLQAEQRERELAQRNAAQQSALSKEKEQLAQREEELRVLQRAAEQRGREATAAQRNTTQREQALATAQWLVGQREQELRQAQAAASSDTEEARRATAQRERAVTLARAAVSQREREVVLARAMAERRAQELQQAQAAAVQREQDLRRAQNQKEVQRPSEAQRDAQRPREALAQAPRVAPRTLTVAMPSEDEAPEFAAAPEPVLQRRAVTLRSYAVADEGPGRQGADPAEAPRVSRAAAPAQPTSTAPALMPAQARPVPGALLAQAGERDAVLVRDVRFEDDGQVARVIIDTAGGAVETSVYNDGRTAVLRLHGAVLARGLTRTLDARAYEGPVQAVSSFADPRAKGTVRLVAQLSRQVAPVLQRRGAQIVWEFRRALAQGSAPGSMTRFFPAARFAGFGASFIPMQLAGRANATLPGRRTRRYEGRRIDLDFKDADIHNILRLLSEVGQINIITSDEVRGSITIRMRDVPWDQALDVILRAKGLGYQREGNLVRVAPQVVLDKEAEQQAARLRQSVEIEPLQTRLIPISYTDLSKIRAQVNGLLSPRGTVQTDDRTNLLIVTDMAPNIALAEDLVRNLDTPTPMVTIEARVVEARASFSRSIGIQWGFNQLNAAEYGNPTGLFFPNRIAVAGGSGQTPTDGYLLPGNPNFLVNFPGGSQALGLQLGNATQTFQLNMRLSAAEATGNIRTISAPKLTTMNNQSANITSGVSIPYVVSNGLAGSTTQFVQANLNLTVKPQVTNDGSVVLQIGVQRAEPDFSLSPPSISTRNITTNLLIKDGETAVIGGIYTRNVGQSYTKIPWLADIPILGWLFKKRSDNDDRTELLIFVSPRILNRNNPLPAPQGAIQ